MTVYTEQDISSSFEGDIEVTANGDLSLADSVESRTLAANFLLRTDNGDYKPNSLIGCNLGTFIGRLSNAENRESMENNILRSLSEQIFSLTDVDAAVVPFALNEVLCVINLAGTYEIDSTLQQVNGKRIAYTFPYIDGTHITPITIE
jgi:hypothetical protein